MSTYEESPVNGETPIPIAPKRRGRKRKSEIPAEISDSNIKREESPSETVSRRGRPRKQINYYDLANPGNVEPEEIPKNKKKERSISIGKPEEEKLITKSPKRNKQTPQSDNIHDSEDFIDNGKQTEDLVEKIIEKDDESLVNGSLINQENTPTTSTSKSDSKSKEKRYNYTGETIKMMNTLFKNSFKATDDSLNDSNNDSPKKRIKKTDSDDEDDVGNTVTHVICAICSLAVEKALWSHHKQKFHNNLAWRVGDTPLDLSNQSLVMSTLNNLYKKKKPLYCDKCQTVKKSVVGFLSHQSICNKSNEQLESVKIACDLCGKKMLPVSLSTHMKYVHTQKSPKEEVAPKESKPLAKKRGAAKKAMKIIENITKVTEDDDKHFTSDFDFLLQDSAKSLMSNNLELNESIECVFKCEFKATSLDVILGHYESCSSKPTEGFICKECLLVSNTLEEVIDHLKSEHDLMTEVEEQHNFTDQNNSYVTPNFLSNLFVKKSSKALFPASFEYNYKFHEDNYVDLLFEDLQPVDFPLLPTEVVLDYLPQMSESCDVAQMKITNLTPVPQEKYDLKKFELFETETHSDHKITIFCGGPVVSLAWLPTPFQNLNHHQILAVSILNSPDETYIISENASVKSSIQFWDFGPMQNKEPNDFEPKLLFSLAHDIGPIWNMEWCPSGCYNFDENNIGRLGILAVTGCDCVHIYSIPNIGENRGLYYKPKSVLKLVLQRPGTPLLGGLEYYPTKISWSKAKGHQYLAVGYTNGFIALFNLKATSVLLRYQEADGSTCFLPQKLFHAHTHSVTALALYHLNGGCRWLLSGSIDRDVNLWDLENPGYPISTSHKNIITDGLWFNNWISHITAYDEASTIVYVNTMMKQARDYTKETFPTTYSPSTITSISGSDWLTGMAHANSAGEIVAVFLPQLLALSDHRRLLRNKRMLFGYSHLIDKRKTMQERVRDRQTLKKSLNKQGKSNAEEEKVICEEPLLYNEAQERYGLLFCDNQMKTFSDFLESTCTDLSGFSKQYTIARPNQYPLSTINKIIFNPNRQASLYYATGYQAGFVRISWMQFLKDDNQVQ